ncbi:MAG: TPM domain-containing protein [Clostridiales bacterium]|nr:TPM domain-containing protein [Clostridiales bacterium]
MSSNGTKKKIKKSIWGEFSLLSAGMLTALIAGAVLCIVFYVFMMIPPAKKVVIEDNAGIFSKDEMEDLESAAKKFSKSNNLNFVIVTTRDKNEDLKGHSKYSNSDEDCNRFAADYYKDKCVTNTLKDNSGFCVLIDLTVDEPGERYIRLFTNGSAYYSVDNEKCVDILWNNRDVLQDGDYAGGVQGVIKDLSRYDYENYGLIMIFAMFGPMIMAVIVCAVALRKGKLDKAPKYKEYLEGADSVVSDEKFLRQKVTVSYDSDSSSGGGGFSGGGGGFSGGGGGGGHSGGGGMRF